MYFQIDEKPKDTSFSLYVIYLALVCLLCKTVLMFSICLVVLHSVRCVWIFALYRCLVLNTLFSLLLLQVIMNPFYDMNKKIESPNFERKVTVSAKKYLLG